MQRYAPRAIRFDGLREAGGWRLKRYSVAYGQEAFDWRAFEPAIALVDATLPRPAATLGRPGVGFIIGHRGRTALYCVLAWWDNENELPVRVFVRDLDGRTEWRAARGSESFCVWDLQVIGFERDAYVATVLAGGADSDGATRAYLGAVLGHEPGPVRLAASPAAPSAR